MSLTASQQQALRRMNAAAREVGIAAAIIEEASIEMQLALAEFSRPEELHPEARAAIARVMRS